MIKYLKWIWLLTMMGINTHIVMNWEIIEPYIRRVEGETFGPIGFWFLSFVFSMVGFIIIALFSGE